jgi:hypothetical protein
LAAVERSSFHQSSPQFSTKISEKLRATVFQAVDESEEVAKTVVDRGEKGGASDGLESDAQNRIYLTNYEQLKEICFFCKSCNSYLK